MKWDPSMIRTVMIKAANTTHLYIYRYYSPERDSLRRENGILHVRGLFCEPGIEWTPGAFRFRKSTATIMALIVDPDWLAQWVMAGILLGERFNPDGGGRRADYEHAVDIWRYWRRWQLGDRKHLFPHECARELHTTPNAVEVQLMRLGLSAKPQ